MNIADVPRGISIAEGLHRSDRDANARDARTGRRIHHSTKESDTDYTEVDGGAGMVTESASPASP